MRFHSQNLNECSCGKPRSSMFWHGRCWWYAKREIRCEWMLFKWARNFAITLRFGGGDNDDEIQFHVCIPWIFSVYLSMAGVFHCKECKTGIAIHNQAIWLYPLCWENEHKSDDSWFRRWHAWAFPWSYDWYSTEVLTQHTPELAKTVWKELKGDRKRRGIDSFEMMREMNKFEEQVTEIHNYVYQRKNGDLQTVKAHIHVDRMVWRMRWWPLLPFNMTRTSIDIRFKDVNGNVTEVGEGTGSWKGGCTGCGYEMLPGETPWQTLQRMEKERTFSR